MKRLSNLLRCAGVWSGSNRLYVSPVEPSDDSDSTVTVTPVLHSTFVRLDQSWAFQNRPQEGSMLIGCDEAAHTITVHWIDTFHNGPRAMVCESNATDQNIIDVRGSYPAPGGPDWGWRIRIDPTVPNQLEISMFNISPDGHEELAVRSNYTPE